MNGQNSFTIDFLDLISSDQLMHAWLLPLVLTFPQNRM